MSLPGARPFDGPTVGRRPCAVGPGGRRVGARWRGHVAPGRSPLAAPQGDVESRPPDRDDEGRADPGGRAGERVFHGGTSHGGATAAEARKGRGGEREEGAVGDLVTRLQEAAAAAIADVAPTIEAAGPKLGLLTLELEVNSQGQVTGATAWPQLRLNMGRVLGVGRRG